MIILRNPSLLIAGFLVLTMAAPAAAQSKNTVHGIELGRWVKEIEPNRYASSRDYKRTIKYFRDEFKGVSGIRWHAEVNLPSVKYIYIENRNRNRLWDGIHLYEIPGGKIRFYILPHIDKKADKQPSPKKDPTKGVVKGNAG